MKKILSIDGCGIRGLIPALGFARDDGSGRPRYTAKDLAGIYQTRGKEIFSRSLWKGGPGRAGR